MFNLKYMWAADVLVCPRISVAHEDVHHARKYEIGDFQAHLSAPKQPFCEKMQKKADIGDHADCLK